jgi:hypothetical protein
VELGDPVGLADCGPDTPQSFSSGVQRARSAAEALAVSCEAALLSTLCAVAAIAMMAWYPLADRRYARIVANIQSRALEQPVVTAGDAVAASGQVPTLTPALVTTV